MNLIRTAALIVPLLLIDHYVPVMTYLMWYMFTRQLYCLYSDSWQEVKEFLFDFFKSVRSHD